MKKTLRTGDLLFPDKLREKLADLVEWKNITVQGYGHEPVSVDEMYAWLEKYAFPWREYLCNTTEYLSAQADAGKSILFEAQLGALRDIDFGIYPYTSSSSTIASYAPIARASRPSGWTRRRHHEGIFELRRRRAVRVRALRRGGRPSA